MVIGDAFPLDQRRTYFLECFKPGFVFYLYCDFTIPPKEKYLLLVCVDSEPLFLIINSEINSFYRSRPHLRDCQVSIPVQSHDFLDHDSFIDCVKVIRGLTQVSVQEQVLTSMMRIKGRIDSTCKEAVMTAITRSRSIEPRFKELILTAMIASKY
jgi:hypothetical protein